MMGTGKKPSKKTFLINPLQGIIFLLRRVGRITWKSAFLIFKFSYFLTKQTWQWLKFIKAGIKFKIWLKKEKKSRSRIIFKRRRFKISLAKPVLFFPKITLSIFTLLALLSFAFYLWILKDLPSPTKLIASQEPVSTKIYDRHGQLLYTIYNGNQNRSLINLTEIPPYLKQATIAMEDKDFYRHQGYSLRGIFRALERNFLNQGTEGGSTITQQLVKNTLLSSEKTLTRKIKELVLAIEVELLYSKDEILQMYFNQIPYGGTAYGIEAAAKTYFGKKTKDLTLAEAALLAGLPAAPTHYSPFGAQPQLAFVRQKEVLKRMVEEGYLKKEEAEMAMQEKIIFAPQATDIKAPHFVMYVKDLLVKKYGRKVVEEGGLEVITSLDLNLQMLAEKEIKIELQKLAHYHVTNGAALITNPQTGEILVMVGSKDYFDQTNDGNVNVTTARRQPGSAIKVVNYAVALESGYTPASIIADTPVIYKNAWETYTPVNYDGRFHGNVTLRTALASSYNIPAVKLLASYGVNKMIEMGKNMGITTWDDPSRFGLSLTLGGGEVKMTDMAVVYGTLANMGKKVDLQPILKITDYKGKILEKYACLNKELFMAQAAQNEICQGQQVLRPAVAYLLTDILADNSARTPAFGPNSSLLIPGYQVAVKTGTTNSKRDNWTIGYTPDYVVAVWVGNNDNTPMSAVASGVTGASPIWHNIMTQLLNGRPKTAFSRPSDLISMQICAFNGLLPCEGCPTKTEYFLPGTEPKTHCDPQAIKKAQEEEEKRQKEEAEKKNPQAQILNGFLN